MPNELRRLYNFQGGLVEDNPLAAAATVLTSAGLAALPAVGATEHVPVTFDPDGIEGAPFVKWITAHTAGASTATVTAAGQEGTTARQVSRDTPWVLAATRLDYPSQPGGSGLLGLTSYRAAADTTYTTTATAPVDLDAANLAVTFVVPSSGKVLVRLLGFANVDANSYTLRWLLREGAADVTGTIQPTSSLVGAMGAGTVHVVAGLTPGTEKTYKWGWYLSAAGTGRAYSGPLFGALTMEVWSVNV